MSLDDNACALKHPRHPPTVPVVEGIRLAAHWVSRPGHSAGQEANVHIRYGCGAIVTVVLALGLSVPAQAFQATAATGRSKSAAEKKTPREHLSAAKSSVNKIAAGAFAPDAAAKVADLKQRLAALERSYVEFGTKTMSKQETASGSTRYKVGHTGDWSTHVADIDTLFAQLVDSKTPIAAAPDQHAALQNKLRDARAHFTAFAVAASGTGGAPDRK
jgi:hypothetical protein